MSTDSLTIRTNYFLIQINFSSAEDAKYLIRVLSPNADVMLFASLQRWPFRWDVMNRTEEYVGRMSSDRGARNYLDALKSLVYDPAYVILESSKLGYAAHEYNLVPTKKGNQ